MLQNSECDTCYERNITQLCNRTELRVTGQHVSTRISKLTAQILKSYHQRPWKHSLLLNNLDFLFVNPSGELGRKYIELNYALKIYEEHGRFNRAITTVAECCLALRWPPWSLFIHRRHCLINCEDLPKHQY